MIMWNSYTQPKLCDSDSNVQMRLETLCRWFESTPSDYEQCEISERIWYCFMNFLSQKECSEFCLLLVVCFSLHSPQVGSSMVERVSPKHLTGVRFLSFLLQFILVAGLLVKSGVTLTANILIRIKKNSAKIF